MPQESRAVFRGMPGRSFPGPEFKAEVVGKLLRRSQFQITLPGHEAVQDWLRNLRFNGNRVDGFLAVPNRLPQSVGHRSSWALGHSGIRRKRQRAVPATDPGERTQDGRKAGLCGPYQYAFYRRVNPPSPVLRLDPSGVQLGRDVPQAFTRVPQRLNYPDDGGGH